MVAFANVSCPVIVSPDRSTSRDAAPVSDAVIVAAPKLPDASRLIA